jgi:hypothetical protein
MGFMMDDRFDERLREAARDYNAPPPVPRDDMWAEIAARRAAERSTVVRPWMRWGIAAAAVLVLGIAIGRYTASVGNRSGLQMADQAPPPPPPPSSGNDIYRVVAHQYLSRTEVFLTGFRADAAVGRLDSSFSSAARELLVSTRLILDSPAGQDPRMRALLEDLELVLAQISQYERGEDAQIIDQGLDQRGVLMRLRAEIPAGPATAIPTQGGAL